MPEEYRQKIWPQLGAKLQWEIGKAGSREAEVTRDGSKADILYGKMPKNYDDFGLHTITLTLGSNTGWHYYQDVELFFHADGTAAPAYTGNGQGFDSHAEAFEYYGQYETSDDKPDNATPTSPVPNKIHYWRELAADAGQQEPQENPGSQPSSLSDAVGNYHVSVKGADMVDTIQIFAGADANAYSFIYVLQHENGHCESWHAPAAQGGWGAAFQYDPSKDQDGDYVHQDFEEKETAQRYENGFSVVQDDSSLRGDWDHETDPTDAEKTLGAGRCRDKEKAVRDREEYINNNDWSDIGPNYNLDD